MQLTIKQTRLQVELKSFQEREAPAVNFFMFSAAKASEKAKARLVSPQVAQA